ncbi:MAG: nickel-dependent hydrogenase large subunit [Desulfurococcales archaeon]|nr:nickel-dependent hydrogenase large subunit [Desulfurococcales archaeon]
MSMRLKEMIIDPITRVEGHIGLRVIVDTQARKPDPNSVRSFVTMFRGFEVFGLGRPPEDAVHITSRICGVCGASHANADVIAADMVYGVSPKPMGVVLRNMAYAVTDHVYDHTIILNMLEGPDYSEAIVSKLTPSVYDEAKKTLAEHRDIHGFTTIADIMKALNPISGKMWQLAVKYQRIAREAGVLIYGRHSHPSTLIPGGISTDLTNAEYLIVGYTYRLTKLTAWAKFSFLVWHDLLTFYNEKIGYEDQGKTYDKATGVSTGLFDDPELLGNLGTVEPEEYYANMDTIAENRIVKPGIMIDGELVSTKYTEINASHMEDVESSFYEEWADKSRKMPFYTEMDPVGHKLLWGKVDPVYHPWNKITIPKRTAKNWAGKYSWSTSVRLVWKDGSVRPFEVGPFMRLKITSVQSSMFGNGNGTLKVTLPRSGGASDLPAGVVDEMTFEWKVPDYSTTTHRLYARAFNMLMDVAAAWINVDHALSLVRSGQIETSRPWNPPKRITYGFGSLEAPRGTVRHWQVQKEGRLLNLQIEAPTTSNVSPRDKYGISPFEMSSINIKITEEVPPEQWQGLDFVRAIRSFDPCLACAVHVEVISGRKGKVKDIKRLLTPACTI